MKYIVTVNGKKYEVEVEQVQEAGSAEAAAAAAGQKPADAVSGEAVRAPMPGNIVAVRVTAGQSVKKGQVLVILEAMKMENEIVAVRDGTISSVAVSKGETVNTNDLLLSLK